MVSYPGCGYIVLVLIFAMAVRIGYRTRHITLKEKHLCQPFARIDFGGQRCGVGDFQYRATLPAGLE